MNSQLNAASAWSLGSTATRTTTDVIAFSSSNDYNNDDDNDNNNNNNSRSSFFPALNCSACCWSAAVHVQSVRHWTFTANSAPLTTDHWPCSSTHTLTHPECATYHRPNASVRPVSSSSRIATVTVSMCLTIAHQ